MNGGFFLKLSSAALNWLSLELKQPIKTGDLLSFIYQLFKLATFNSDMLNRLSSANTQPTTIEISPRFLNQTPRFAPYHSNRGAVGYGECAHGWAIYWWHIWLHCTSRNIQSQLTCPFHETKSFQVPPFPPEIWFLRFRGSWIVQIPPREAVHLLETVTNRLVEVQRDGDTTLIGRPLVICSRRLCSNVLQLASASEADSLPSKLEAKSL